MDAHPVADAWAGTTSAAQFAAGTSMLATKPTTMGRACGTPSSVRRRIPEFLRTFNDALRQGITNDTEMTACHVPNRGGMLGFVIGLLACRMQVLTSYLCYGHDLQGW